MDWYSDLKSEIDLLSQKPSTQWYVALSGGLDSVLLLYLVRQAVCSTKTAVNLKAIHVNHGISQNAYRWQDFVSTLCHKLSVPLLVRELTLPNNPSEAAAREGRWNTFEDILHTAYKNCGSGKPRLWLAHHLDDQVETMLFNSFRGTGLKGLTAMRRLEEREHFYLHRPLLDISKQDLIDRANALKLEWVEDESNTDQKYSRNYLRHSVVPTIEARFPKFREQYAKLNKRIEEAQSLLDDLAMFDLATTVQSNCLTLTKFNNLSRTRRINLLRYWLRQHSEHSITESKINEFLQQIKNVSTESKVQLELEKNYLFVYDENIYCVLKSETIPVKDEVEWHSITTPIQFASISLQCKSGTDFRAPKQGEEVTLRTRRAKDKCRFETQSKTKTIKKLFNDLRVPHWERDRIPLVFYNKTLIYIVGYGATEAGKFKSGEGGLSITVSKEP